MLQAPSTRSSKEELELQRGGARAPAPPIWFCSEHPGQEPKEKSSSFSLYIHMHTIVCFGTQVMSSCRLNVRIPLTVEPAGQDISPASHAPLPWRCREPRADAGAKASHVATDAARKNPLCKHAAPASERRSAVCKAQSLSSSLIHMIIAPH